MMVVPGTTTKKQAGGKSKKKSKENCEMDAKKFLQKKGLINPGYSKFKIRFPSGDPQNRDVDLCELMEEFARKENKGLTVSDTKEIARLLKQLPSGIDYDALPDDENPEDKSSHVTGLIWNILEKVEGVKK